MRPYKAIKLGFSRLWNFNSRSSRSEYWWMWAASLAIVVVLQVILSSAFGGSRGFTISTGQPISAATALAATKHAIILNCSIGLISLIMLPVTARRFKDHGWRGGWFLWAWRLNFLSFAVAFAASFALLLGSDAQGFFARWSIISIFVSFPPYASALWCFWIGFVRADPIKNKYGPNPLEVAQ